MSNFLKNLFGNPEDLKAVYLRGAIILDVRMPMEFKTGHIRGAVNVPLDSLQAGVADLKKKGKPIIACCRSGARSGMAVNMLSQAGLEAYNGGPWSSLERVIR